MTEQQVVTYDNYGTVIYYLMKTQNKEDGTLSFQYVHI